jgi:hypothetical protein
VRLGALLEEVVAGAGDPTPEPTAVNGEIGVEEGRIDVVNLVEDCCVVDVGLGEDPVGRGGNIVDNVPTVMVVRIGLVPDAVEGEDRADGMEIGAVADARGVSNEPVIWSILTWKLEDKESEMVLRTERKEKKQRRGRFHSVSKMSR